MDAVSLSAKHASFTDCWSPEIVRERGPLLFEYATFQANDDPALKLAIYMPVKPDRA